MNASINKKVRIAGIAVLLLIFFGGWLKLYFTNKESKFISNEIPSSYIKLFRKEVTDKLSNSNTTYNSSSTAITNLVYNHNFSVFICKLLTDTSKKNPFEKEFKIEKGRGTLSPLNVYNTINENLFTLKVIDSPLCLNEELSLVYDSKRIDTLIYKAKFRLYELELNSFAIKKNQSGLTWVLVEKKPFVPTDSTINVGVLFIEKESSLYLVIINSVGQNQDITKIANELFYIEN